MTLARSLGLLDPSTSVVFRLGSGMIIIWWFAVVMDFGIMENQRWWWSFA
jgi:hypothetical protein